ncbi:restriction endonuclease subunit S [Corallibacter sp.]|uniref:restriction endonuclease subunit S n=1 Tax=Corallibacter sp. TaxID=2038084 RepID=UPI003A94479E
MNAYPKYKTIAFEYVTQIPEDWDLLPNIAIFEERNEKGHIHEELLSVTIGKGVIKQSELNKKDSSNPDKSNYKLVEIGDIVYSMRFRQGASGYSNYKGLVSNACTVLKPKMKINPKFFHYQYRLPFYQNYAERYSYGIADGQKPLRWQDFKRMYAFVPPLETQNQIVTYLEEKEKHIKKFIKKKKELINLAKDERKVLITHIIEKEHLKFNFDKTRLKYISNKISDGLHSTPEYEDSTEYYFINGNNLIDGKIVIGKKTRSVSESEYNAHRKQLNSKTILFSINGSIGNIAHYNNEQIILGKSAAYINLKKNVNRNYIFYLLQSYLVSSFYDMEKTGTTIYNLSLQSIKNTPILLPSEDKQEEISQHISNEIKKVDKLILTTMQEIKLSEDLLKSLIEQVVTGKMKVPNTYNSKKDTISIAAEPVNTYNTP